MKVSSCLGLIKELNSPWLVYCNFFAICMLLASCDRSPSLPDPVFKKVQIANDSVGVFATKDTIRFPLTEDIYNDIKSFNLFVDGSREYISFYDRRSASINIYEVATKKLFKTISLKHFFKRSKPYKTSVFVKSFDSLFITNQLSMYLLDKEGREMRKIDFLHDPQYEWAYFDNITPPVFRGNILFTGVRPYVNGVNLKAVRNWKTLYAFDLSRNTASLYYSLPKIYRNNLYGDKFLAYNYCVNAHGNFVFNFPADTNVYETDLSMIHYSYNVKSKFQKNPIPPVKKELLETDKGSQEYALRHAYRAIFYDPYQQRYWRISKRKMSMREYILQERKFTITVLNEKMEIMGESEINDDISLSTIFFTREGGIYARVNVTDEHFLNYVRLSYTNESLSPIRFAAK